jgi:hypothetical protein
LPAAINKLAVREENTMVARVTLHNMRQDRDEPVRKLGYLLLIMSSPYVAAHHSILAVELRCHGRQFLLLQCNRTIVIQNTLIPH